MVAVEITVPGGIPSNVAVRLGKLPFAITVKDAFFGAFTGFLIAGSGHSPDGSSVTGKRKGRRIDQSEGNGNIEELLFV